ncbi:MULTISPECIES: acetyl-CoA carboxylase biotin carboxyl carrier protein [Bacteroidota]|uniref:Biotin carboxyl carrier protein of acetyl-CoA carboxylase n=1 Tax=Flectobacillus roseus TaxID=502259 RepID=A0ABT6YBK9_9BACT|nr:MULTISPECIES: acetyl-CoA carboxylase biotin carboxyl carrier protein [Bacteroidota]MDI9860973.1 acetyl-CoA carboxylase biotin carboxyl carrier protein [Flectobacillus roseus]NBB27665.1 acetyl-CoA carboxylase biotin carboxyl carrier protein [Cellulophaga sp. BC115SP]
MENKEIQKLLDFIAQSTLDEVNIETSELKLSVKRYGQAPVVQQVVATPAPVVAAAPVAAPAAAAPAAPAAAPVAASNRVTIKSPMIGTFYRSSSPDSPSFVEIGSEVTKGKPVCIIEAMKLFNEIESEVSGRIVEVLVENATPVEFDQPLFVVEQ